MMAGGGDLILKVAGVGGIPGLPRRKGASQ
jgi:hypothetical protein